MGLVRELGPRWDTVNAAHIDLIRRAVDAHGGAVVRTEGDAVFAAFREAGAAVAAAVDAQRAIVAPTGQTAPTSASGWASTGRGPPGRRRLRRVRGQPGGAGRGGRPRRPDRPVRDDPSWSPTGCQRASRSATRAHTPCATSRGRSGYTNLTSPGCRRDFPPLRTAARGVGNLRRA